MWENAFFYELLDEAIRCDRQLNISQPQKDEDHKIRILHSLYYKENCMSLQDE